MAKKTDKVEQLRITRTRSGIGAKDNHIDTLRSLGLRKIGDTVVRANDPITQGMVRTVSHMVIVEVIEEAK